MPYATSIFDFMANFRPDDISKEPAPPLTGAALARYNMIQLRKLARTSADLDEWHPVKVLYHYMRLRAHQFIPETKRLVEQLQNQALDTLPKSVREGHQGRLRFLKRCFEHSVRVLTETEHHGGAKIDQDWVMVDVGAIDGEMWDEFEGHSKESAER